MKYSRISLTVHVTIYMFSLPSCQLNIEPHSPTNLIEGTRYMYVFYFWCEPSKVYYLHIYKYLPIYHYNWFKIREDKLRHMKQVFVKGCVHIFPHTLSRLFLIRCIQTLSHLFNGCLSQFRVRWAALLWPMPLGRPHQLDVERDFDREVRVAYTKT